jgi:NAD(P)-dependent dehydrogenase (short-subunit alcohol dehydrogenase family)
VTENIPTYPDLAGKVAVVTGGSGGIGAASCRLLAANGARVAVHGRDEARIQEEWEDSPQGYSQTPPYVWWKWHDAYDSEPSQEHLEQTARALEIRGAPRDRARSRGRRNGGGDRAEGVRVRRAHVEFRQ